MMTNRVRLPVFAIALLLLTACAESTEEPGAGDTASSPSPVSTPESGAANTPESEPSPEVTATSGDGTTTSAAGEADIPEYEIDGGNRELYVTDLTGEREQRLTDSPAMNASPAWSPDGEQIAWVQVEDDDEREAGLYVANADGSDMRLVTSPARPLGIDWHPDGDRIAFVSSQETDSGWDEVHTVRVDGSERQQITFWEEIPTEQQYYGSTYPAWSPDGERLAVIVDQLDAFEQIHVLDLASDDPADQLTDIPDQRKGSPTWSPDGSQIAFHATPHDSHYPQIFLTDTESGETTAIETQEEVAFLQPDWSPDGQWITLSVTADIGPQIEIMRSDGSERQPITNDTHGNTSPRWSPDGSRLLFIAERDNQLAEPCSRHADALLGPQPSLEELAWSSHHVVVGTVIEEHPPAWAEPLNQPMDTCLTIWSDYTVEVEQQFRGQPAETLRIRLPGGQIGDYEQIFNPSLEIATGDRLLMFLTEDRQRELLPEAYTTGIQRAWAIADGQIQEGEYSGMSLSEAGQIVRNALTGEPADTGPFTFIPLEEAPIHAEQDESEGN